MRKGVVVLAAGLAIVGFSIVGSNGDATAGTDLRLFLHDTQQAQLDLGDDGDTLGDRFVESGDVFDHEGGTKIGRLGGFCETVSRRGNGDGEDICSITFVLERGQLATSYMADHADLWGGTPQPFSITGGSGIYRNARGEGTVTILNATDAITEIRLN